MNVLIGCCKDCVGEGWCCWWYGGFVDVFYFVVVFESFGYDLWCLVELYVFEVVVVCLLWGEVFVSEFVVYCVFEVLDDVVGDLCFDVYWIEYGVDFVDGEDFVDLDVVWCVGYFDDFGYWYVERYGESDVMFVVFFEIMFCLI